MNSSSQFALSKCGKVKFSTNWKFKGSVVQCMYITRGTLIAYTFCGKPKFLNGF